MHAAQGNQEHPNELNMLLEDGTSKEFFLQSDKKNSFDVPSSSSMFNSLGWNL